MRELPGGTVTFLFTDVEGSTRLLHELGADRYASALAAHRRALREAFAAHGGVEVDTQGDAFFVAFPAAAGAVSAAQAAQAALVGGSISVRMGIHTGAPLLTQEGYVGADVHAGARVAAAGHGGQVLVSKATADLLDGSLPLVDLGEHRLKDLDESVWIFQLGDGSFPPPKTLSNTNLPVPASSFVGRKRELEEAEALLGQARLMTILGPGGAGKTRFAIELASRELDRIRNGVFWVGLAGVRDPALVLETAGRTVGATDGLAAHIADRRMLLLLDNLEQVIGAAPELASLVEACPNLTVIVTSRELMRVRGERVYGLPPLEPDEGVALFCERAGVEPSETVTELSRRLDGLPLALELAAARATVLTPEQLLDRLSQRLDLLRGGRDADPRQQTLRATIEWSYDLLNVDEQLLFGRLAVLAGGWTIETAEAIAGAGLDAIQSLVEKSLVRRTGERFWMLETIREYALERLRASGEEERLRRRHAERFLEFAPSLGLCMESLERGIPQRHDVAIVEHDNFRAAIEWAHGHEPELALRIACALENFWVTNSPAEGHRLFETLIAEAGDLPPELRAQALRCRGSSTSATGRADEAKRLYEESLALYRAIGDERGVAHLLARCGFAALQRGEWAEARRLLRESADRAQAGGFRMSEAIALTGLGSVEHHEGNVERALELTTAGLGIARTIGFTWWEANTLDTLAEYALELGRPDEAELHAGQALELAQGMGDRRVTVWLLARLAWCAAARGDAARSGRLWGALEAEEAFERPGGSWPDARGKYERHVLCVAGDEFEHGRTIGRRLPLQEAVAYSLAESERSSNAA